MSGAPARARGPLWLCLLLLLLPVWRTPPAAAAPLQVGSKRDTEGTILGELAAALLRARGLDAVYRPDLSGGTQVLWRALLNGDIDVYPEYTGTLSRDLLRDEHLTSPALLRARLVPMGLQLGESLGFNDSYGLGVREELARRLSLSRISDLRGQPGLRLGFSHEFLERPEGFPGLQKRYELPWTTAAGFEHELSYRAIAAGQVDVVDVYTTDAEIDAYQLRVLEDDRRHFPLYEPVMLYRQGPPAPGVAGMVRGAPLPEAARAVLRELEGRISRAEMVKMNRRVKLDKQPEAAVAAAFLRDGLGTSATAATPSRAAEIGRRTREHLLLVAISLLLAVLVSVPVGVGVARWPRIGQVVLGGLGVIQTIPSLAVLVFMIPLLGVGTAPAVVALFLYSLLPIVRGTATGLLEIPPPLRESAAALGLSPWAQLWQVELPLSSRSILSGIKTAAVINVGTATIGALIGAGGYGQPILAGIRRDDLGMLLEGAVPAAVLALLVQGAFELLERAVVPRGLRLQAQPSADR